MTSLFYRKLKVSLYHSNAKASGPIWLFMKCEWPDDISMYVSFISSQFALSFPPLWGSSDLCNSHAAGSLPVMQTVRNSSWYILWLSVFSNACVKSFHWTPVLVSVECSDLLQNQKINQAPNLQKTKNSERLLWTSENLKPKDLESREELSLS